MLWRDVLGELTARPGGGKLENPLAQDKIESAASSSLLHLNVTSPMNSPDATFERVEVHYRGRVQGVGFRWNAQHIARGHEVQGTVRNLPSGEVHLIAEGSRAAVRAFLDEVYESMRLNITGVDERKLPATGEFIGFKIVS